MVIQTMKLDPNAQSYTDDEIVGKVNSATAQISRVDALAGEALGGCDTDDLGEGAGNLYDTGEPPATLEDLGDGATRKAMLDTEKTKLAGVEADAKDDQTGPEVRDLIVAIADADRKLVVTAPTTGEFKVVAVQRDATGLLDVDYDDVAE